MYCRRCGKELPLGANFCVHCGALVGNESTEGYTDPYSAPESIPAPRRDGKKGRGSSAVAILVVVVILAGALIVLYPNLMGTEEDTRSVTIGELTVYRGMCEPYIVSSDDGDVATLRYTGDGTAEWYVKTLSASALVSLGNGYYEERGYEIHQGDVLTLDNVGDYEIHLYVDGSLQASGEAVLDGTITSNLNWSRTYMSRTYTYSVTIQYEYSDYQKYADMDVTRSQTTLKGNASFVVVDDALLSISKSLETTYKSVHGADASTVGQSYADYLLSFVQCKFEYPEMVVKSQGVYYKSDQGSPDLTLYGANEYWAFPMETIFHGAGDCEDTSILYAALCSASGMYSTIVVLPEHMVAGVALSGFNQDALYSVYSLTSLSTASTGRTYYFGETTFDRHVGLGYLDPGTSSDVKAIRSIYEIPPYSEASS